MLEYLTITASENSLETRPSLTAMRTVAGEYPTVAANATLIQSGFLNDRRYLFPGQSAVRGVRSVVVGHFTESFDKFEAVICAMVNVLTCGHISALW